MSTFQEKYCAARGCRGDEFVPQIFWRALHRHALVIAPVAATMDRDYFALDRELIAVVGRARTMGELDEELRDFRHDERNHHWWRMRARLRLSTRRLRRIAGTYLAAAPAGSR